MPAPEVVRACLNKAETYQIVSRLAIPLPKGETVSDLSALINAATSIGYPVIVKPRSALQPFLDRKAIVCSFETELASAFAGWPNINDVIIQQFVNGTRYNCEFAAVDGRLLTYFEHKVLRSERLDDIGSEVEGITVGPTTILRQYCERFLFELKYSGVGCIQFLLDESQGTACFLEINPRLDGSCALPWHYAFDLPTLAIDIARGHKRASQSASITLPPYPIGKRVHWCSGDIEGLIDALKSDNLTLRDTLLWVGKILRAALRANCHMTWWWKDPVPTLILYRRLLATLWRRVKKAFISGILKARSPLLR
jgi:biotin carboxylase